jgi:PAS domain-containing protein
MTGLLGDSKLSLADFLNSIELPVLVTDGAVTVRQVNRTAARILGKAASRLEGSSVGVAIECIHAGIMGECGVSAYCAGCEFRRAIHDTHADGKPRYGEYSQHKLVTANGTKARQFRFSTTKMGDAVVLAIEGIEDLPVAR